MSSTTPRSGSFVIRELGLAAINLPTKFEVSRSEDLKGNTGCGKGWFGVVMGH